MKFNRAYLRILRLCLLLSTLLGTFISAPAQDTRGSLVITVKDSQDAVISGASVTINQTGCQCGECPPEVKDCKSACCDTRNNPPTCCIVALTRTSDEEGNVTFAVNAGVYDARIEVQNFKAKEVKGIQVSLGQSNRVEVKLEVGVNLDDVVFQKTGSASSTRAKTLTVEVKNESEMRARVTVSVSRLGCTCGVCPAGKVCPSDCCECKQGDCVCCIVASQLTDSNGVRSFSVQPGEYEVSFKVAETSWGTLSGVTIGPNAKEVKLPVTILKALPPK